MTIPLESPCSPHLIAAGLAVCGGASSGRNVAGRLTKFHPTADDTGIVVNIEAESLTSAAESIFTFLNGKYGTNGQSRKYRVNVYGLGESTVFEAIPLPPASGWKNWYGAHNGTYQNNLKVTWEGDPFNERYVLHHATLEDKSDAHQLGQFTWKDSITVTETTATGAEITVTGNDGVAGRDGDYTISVTEASGTVSITITDNTDGEVVTQDRNDTLPVVFGRGLSVSLEDPWPLTGQTATYTVTTTTTKEFMFRKPADAEHYFRVQAFRGDDETAYSSWVSKTVDNPPGPVTGVGVAFDTAASVIVSFTMPADADILEYRLYLSRDWDVGNYIPHWIPEATGISAPGAEVSVTLSGLSAGKYYFYVRSVDELGKDDETTDVYTFTLTTSNVSWNPVSPPQSIVATSTEAQSVTIRVQVDETISGEDTLYIYWDDSSGTVEYSASFDEIPVSDKDDGGFYTKTYTGIYGGTYLFAARCGAAGVIEQNTSVTDEVTVFTDAMVAPSNLTITEVPNG